MPRHGFARDLIFEVVQISEQELLFTLQHSADTLRIYPFPFKLGIRYHLAAASLSCTYEIENPADQDLWFSIGGHPAFATPLNNEGAYTDYYLQFEDDEELICFHIEDNLISDKTSTVALTDKKLFLKHDLFYQDALVFKNMKSHSISLMNTKNYNGINFKFDDFPYFGIWAARDASFVCLEPWCGIADSLHHQHQLTKKEGMIPLGAHQHWQRSWQITCF
ncbi:Protein LacX, plasmid [compost metagenome]